ncbi:thiamine phosphate synthase [Peptoniphilaceae bacterium SGI.131]
MGLDRKNLLLYAVTDRTWLKGESLKSQVEKAIKGGVTFVQLREKMLDKEDFLDEAKEIGDLCRDCGVPFVINDNVEIARASGADGVHLGQKDMDILDARKILGNDKIIGISCQTVDQAKAAESRGADYIGVGAVFQTGSKGDAKEISHDVVRDITRSVSIPVIAIGGISYDNLSQLKNLGLAGVAVISAIFAQDNIEKATAALREKLISEIVR